MGAKDLRCIMDLGDFDVHFGGVMQEVMANQNNFFADGHLRYQNGHWRDDNGDAVDVVKVVRCKDCWREETYEDPLTYYCNWLDTIVGENWFCGDGERECSD